MKPGTKTGDTGGPAHAWTVDDLIDFEYLAAHDPGAEPTDHGPPSAAAARFAEAVRSNHRSAAFLAWLGRARSRSDEPLPGEIYRRGLRATSAVVVVAGFLFGAALAGKLLSHGETEPVNALMFFGWTAGLQVGLLLFVAIAWTTQAMGLRFGLLHDALLILIDASGRAANRLPGARRMQVRAGWSTVEDRSGRLAPVVGCQLLIVTQLFAIAFNVGLIVAMLLVYLPFEELRFGWQSTYSFSADGVAAWVRAVALPWSWISATLVPDAAQIAATRYTRGQPAATLPAAQAHAWWPFLISALAFYGLTVRTLLALTAAAILRRRLGSLRFDHPAANALWRRFEGPLFRSGGNHGLLPDVQAVPVASRGGRIDVLVVDHELAAHRDDVERSLSTTVVRVFDVNIDDDALPVALREGIDGAGRVVVATPASRDPIVAIAGFLDALAREAGAGSSLTLVLVPDAASADQTRPTERLTIWTRFLAIHRLPVAVEAL